MCELFGMSSRWPTEVAISLEELASHSDRGDNREGWGIAYYDERDVRLIKEPGQAGRSPCLRLIEEEHLASRIVVAHIRRASRGAPALRNTHPFERELGGRRHVFAHNGDVSAVFDDARFAIGRFRPVGETDSEYAFCALLERLAAQASGGELPALPSRLDLVARFAAELGTLGPANFLYSDGATLFAHSDLRYVHPDRPPEDPGLHLLHHTWELSPDPLHAGGVRIAPAQAQEVTMVASVPLSAEAWTALPRGTVVALEDGRAVASRRPPGAAPAEA